MQLLSVSDRSSTEIGETPDLRVRSQARITGPLAVCVTCRKNNLSSTTLAAEPMAEGALAQSTAEFIHKANIDRVKRELETELDPARRKLIVQLLEEEIKKLDDAQKGPPARADQLEGTPSVQRPSLMRDQHWDDIAPVLRST
ncbi:hypothetical protein OOJ09_31685 [Mesorhizobium qingshengii]|uniref:Uncharacterized protein n=1 Tax=Mesorhizobium qingshengii TaxID=1165689 RepID=A0ABT4R4G8_9HYPH|nr:hypothetical protein [Mesorhizobium qingshengii]MCZ8548737.1 hypothetical protein [Mesorhizobium qingshengii]